MTTVLVTTPTLLKYSYKLTGVVPFPFTTSKPTKISQVVSHIWPIFFCLYFISIYLFYTSVNNETKIFSYINFLVYHWNVLYMVVYVVMLHKRSTKVKKLLTEISKIQLITNNNSKSNERYVRIIQIVTLVCLLVTFLLRNIPLTYTIYFMYPCTISTFDNLFINDVLNEFCNKFKTINRKFENIVAKFGTSESDFNIEIIQKLSHHHYNLVSLVLEMIKQFEITLIVAITQTFIVMVDSVYTVTFLIFNKRVLTFHFGCNLFFVHYAICWLFNLIRKFSETQEETNKAGSYVHCIWNKYSLRGNIEKKMRYLELVSLRLLNTKVNFTASGCFNLDWTLLQTIIAGVTTYWVILVQFPN
ncbi:gustatory receptor 128 [Tribolium castaneum]|uniref:Gustatory receptor n=1 Tax=Tribolium castaneum TaxID=7070 RepID=D6WTL5_TRICA|nr:gustatory receptor 128 [Tribolium castaneum]